MSVDVFAVLASWLFAAVAAAEPNIFAFVAAATAVAAGVVVGSVVATDSWFAADSVGCVVDQQVAEWVVAAFADFVDAVEFGAAGVVGMEAAVWIVGSDGVEQIAA